MMNVLKTIVSADGLRKVEIFQRPDGTYGFEAYSLSRQPHQGCWIGQGFDLRTDDPAIAEREALERVDWMKMLDGMTVNERLSELNLLDEFDAAKAAGDVEKLQDVLVRARLDQESIRAIVKRL